MKTLKLFFLLLINIFLFLEIKTIINYPGFLTFSILVILNLLFHSKIKNNFLFYLTIVVIIIISLRYKKPTLELYSEDGFKNKLDYILTIIKMTGNEYNIKLKTNLKDINNKKNTIPFGVKSNELLFNNPYCSIFDDKQLFYDFLKKNMKSSTINLIPSFDQNYKGKNFKKKLIVKHKNGKGSENIKYVEDFLYNVIEKYGKDHQIQEIIDFDKSITLSAFCKDGKFKYYVSHLYYDKLTPYSYIMGVKCKYLKNPPPEIFNYCKKIINITKFNGYVEFEFLKSKKNKLYIMECNPRLSGEIRIIYYFNEIVKHTLPKKNNFLSRINEKKISSLDFTTFKLYYEIFEFLFE